MNNSQKGKPFDRVDRDGVAQHRNVMAEIAMKKQITMYQREEKILERELREISKVKETLLQIRAPLRRKVQAAAFEDDLVESSGAERNLRKVSVATRKTSVSTTGAQQKCANKQHTDSTSASKRQSFSGRTSLQVLTPSPNVRQRKISAMELRTQQNTPQGISGGKTLAQRKTSAPVFVPEKSPVAEDNSKSGFLPVIRTPNPPAECSPSVKRKTPLLDRPVNGDKTDEVEYYTRSRSPSLLTPIAPSRMDMNISRARSVPCELPSYPVKTPRGRRQSEADECASLTMEETLRIKGKFRQIGHSVIATALLKGLKQKGQLSSEAIHNMHKPISLDEASEAKIDENKGPDDSTSEAKEQEDNEEVKVKSAGHGRQSFRSLARKTINVNRMLSVANTGRRRAQSDPAQTDKSSSANAAYSRPKTVGNSTVKQFEKGLGQEKVDTSNGSTSGAQRRKDSNESQQDFNVQGDESENSSQTQQMYKKQSVDVDPLRPLMNPRTAHARRRKNTLTGDMRDFCENNDSVLRDTEPQSPQSDEQTTANKCVRFAVDAWT